MSIKANEEIFEINLVDQIFTLPNSQIIKGRELFQSELTSKVVKNILLKNKCELTKISDSIQQHEVFIKGLLKHWNNYKGKEEKILPIT